MSASDVLDHYQNLLARHYTWMSGTMESRLEENTRFFTGHHLLPKENRLALDLGAGSGFQSIPLAKLGYDVTAIDLSDKLLSELRSNAEGCSITTVQDDLLNFEKHCPRPIALCVCMGDTLTHLDSRDQIQLLLDRIYHSLEAGGHLVLTFRDLTFELTGVDRFLPIRSDDTRIFTCFLEYDPEHVTVHDLVYEKEGTQWILQKSSYRKCRIGYEWIREALTNSGFQLEFSQAVQGVVSIIAIQG